MPDVGPIKKNPLDNLVYAMNFGFQPEIVNGSEVFDLAGSPTMAVTASNPPGDTSLTFGAASYSGQKVIALASGGTNGVTYTVTATAGYVSGNSRALTGTVQVVST
jgi:hypothetical protein